MSNPPTRESKPPEDPYDFSLVLGGPLYQLFARAHLSGTALELLARRVIVISLFAWLPLAILSILGGRAWGDAVRVPFLVDLEAHARFLLALPLLIVAELVVHQRMRPVVRQFLERDLIHERSRARFDLAVASAVRLRNSVMAEVLLIAFVYLVGALYVWPRFNIALIVSTWYACSSSFSSAGISGCSCGCASSGMSHGAISSWCPRTPIAPAASASCPSPWWRSRPCCWPTASC
jgi:hypothetical protein